MNEYYSREQLGNYHKKRVRVNYHYFVVMYNGYFTYMADGGWLSVLPSTINGTELGAQEWRYSLFLIYGIDPPDLHEHFNGCGAAFEIYHALNCKKEGLITARRNELRDGIANLEKQGLHPHARA